MTLYRPVFMQPVEGEIQYSAEELRQGVVAVIGDAGVIDTAALKVTQRAAGANMSVDVAVGRCIIAGVAGSYLCRSDAVEHVTIAAAPSSGNGRIDVVYAQVRDAQAQGSGSDQDWVIDVVAGTPASSPAAPALPARSIELARVTLTDATTTVTNGIITDARRTSVSPADRRWPIVASVDLAEHAVNDSADTWGSITIPAPNRQVQVTADVHAQFRAGDGEESACYGELAVRLQFGATLLTPQGISGRSDDPLDSVPITNGYTWTVTPGIGQALVISARVVSVVDDTVVEFTNGHMRVEVYPV